MCDKCFCFNFSLQKIAILIDRQNLLGPAGIMRGLRRIVRSPEKANFYFRPRQPSLSCTAVWILSEPVQSLHIIKLKITDVKSNYCLTLLYFQFHILELRLTT